MYKRKNCSEKYLALFKLKDGKIRLKQAIEINQLLEIEK